MPRAARFFVLFLIAALVVSAAVPVLGTTPSAADLIALADAAYINRHIEESMTEALALYESILPSLASLSVQTQAYVLNRLSQLCYEAALFTEGTTPEDGELYTKGKEYGFRSLRLNEDFVAHESEGLEAALAYATDLMAMHWLANNWGMLCGMNPLQGFLQQGNVLVLFARCVELDPRFWGASSGSALGSLLIMLPGPMGGDDEAGLALVEDSIVLDPSYLNNHIILAEYWGFTYNMFGALTGIQNAELVRRELAIVLEGEIGDWPFWNRQAKIAAERLLAQLQELEG